MTWASGVHLTFVNLNAESESLNLLDVLVLNGVLFKANAGRRGAFYRQWSKVIVTLHIKFAARIHNRTSIQRV